MFDNIVIFTQLVEIGSFSKTADILNIAPSTLTRKIQDLESNFNKILLVRDTRNFKLTPQGEILYNSFKDLRHRLDSFLNIINPTQHTGNKELNISLPPSHALYLISPYISYFNQKYPKIKLNLFYQPQEPDIHNGLLNLAITIHKFEHKDYVQEFLRMEPVQFYCTPEYAKKYGLPLIVEDLSNHDTIGGIDPQDQVLNNIPLINKYTNECLIYNSKKDSIKSNNLIHALEIGRKGEHIFPCWAYVCDPMVQKGELIQVLPEYYVHQNRIYLVSRKQVQIEEQIFIDFIRKCMNKSIRVDILNTQ